MMLTEISRLRMVASSLSNSSGSATLANSSMTKCTWTGSSAAVYHIRLIVELLEQLGVE